MIRRKWVHSVFFYTLLAVAFALIAIIAVSN